MLASPLAAVAVGPVVVVCVVVICEVPEAVAPVWIIPEGRPRVVPIVAHWAARYVSVNKAEETQP
jgi:hypothetical protein